MNDYVTHLGCVSCGRTFEPDDSMMTCPACGEADGILDILFDLERISKMWKDDPLEDRPQNIWRYHELLPLDESRLPVHWQVGWTPIINAKRLAAELGVEQFLMKDDTRNPTASLKDRASSVGVTHAYQQAAKTIACSSTGNAATSLAGHAALAGMPAVIFLPRHAPEPKLAQLLMYGATVFSVQGTYDEAYQLCSNACAELGWYNRNCAINPVLVEGKKTCGLEIAEQCMMANELPDWVVVSIGDGCTIAGIWKGLVEMYKMGLTDKLPRLLGVQSATVAPILHALRHEKLPTPNDKTTIADSINVQVPRNWRKAVRALKESRGSIAGVSDEQILEAMRVAGSHGVFAEPAAAAAVAGAIVAVNQGMISAHDRVLTVVTGSGLKDIKSAIQAGGKPLKIEPTIDAVRNAVASAGINGDN